jgi:nucleoside-diphosphate-sugar epimerase
MDLAFQLLSNSKVGNFVFCTGTSISTVDFIKIVCAKLHVESRDLFRILTINEELESSHRFTGDNSKICNTTGVDKSQILSGQTLIEKLIRDWQNKYDAE